MSAEEKPARFTGAKTFKLLFADGFLARLPFVFHRSQRLLQKSHP